MNKIARVGSLVFAVMLLTLSVQPATAGGPGTVTYTYDSAGRLVEAAYGNGMTISYAYDAAGNVLSRTIEQDFTLYLPLVLRGASS